MSSRSLANWFSTSSWKLNVFKCSSNVNEVALQVLISQRTSELLFEVFRSSTVLSIPLLGRLNVVLAHEIGF